MFERGPRIIGQRGGAWTVATTGTLFVQLMPPPRRYQIQAVEPGLDAIVPGHGVAHFRCHLTGDGEGMASMNYTRGKKCWCCDDSSSSQPANAVARAPRWGGLVRCVSPERRVGDYVFVRICNVVRNALVPICVGCQWTGRQRCWPPQRDLGSTHPRGSTDASI